MAKLLHELRKGSKECTLDAIDGYGTVRGTHACFSSLDGVSRRVLEAVTRRDP